MRVTGFNQSLQSFVGETREIGTMKLTFELKSKFAQNIAASLVASALLAGAQKLAVLLNVMS